ncbi:hypothetical protein MTR_7g013020 [Medicago truncatula]|uniref:Uncharacterized protein n=1 Tax=Medicago truncatula TaxID=3880 RepID=G7L577_MEDTR|nr:hypothetical protein MTR_7g013020 [Medicago truncatula]
MHDNILNDDFSFRHNARWPEQVGIFRIIRHKRNPTFIQVQNTVDRSSFATWFENIIQKITQFPLAADKSEAIAENEHMIPKNKTLSPKLYNLITSSSSH